MPNINVGQKKDIDILPWSLACNKIIRYREPLDKNFIRDVNQETGCKMVKL